MENTKNRKQRTAVLRMALAKKYGARKYKITDKYLLTNSFIIVKYCLIILVLMSFYKQHT
jgi:hypothetical protein